MEETKNVGTPGQTSRKVWQEPKIVLERSLLVTAQGPSIGGNSLGEQPGAFLGPLNGASGGGVCGA